MEEKLVRRTRWHSVPTQQGTFINILNNEFQRLDSKYPGFFPDIQAAETLLLGSDYSGESSTAPYFVYSFLLATLESWTSWEQNRLLLRKQYLSNSRRMAFKRLTDGQRKKALIPFLEAANALKGLSLSIGLNKRCNPILPQPPLDLSNPQFVAYRKWKTAILDKAFLILHVLGVLLGGLAAPGQNVIWLTDEDSIAANDDRIRELTQLFAWISSGYLTFNLGHCRCGTSRCDDGSRQIEDFLAIPDLIAGALAEQLAIKNTDPSALLRPVFWMHRSDFSEKTQKITWWFSDSRHSLKRLVCLVDPAANEKSNIVSWFHFYDQK